MKKVLCIAECVVCILLLLSGVFQKEEWVFTFFTEELRETYNGQLSQSELISLTPGIYQIRVEATGETEGGSITLKSMESTFRALRTNTVHLFAGSDYVDFEAYVLDTVENAYLEVVIGENDIEKIHSIELVKTGKGMTIFFFGLLCIIGIFHVLYWLRGRIIAGKMSLQQQVILGGICLAVLISYIPFATDYFLILCDLPFHLLRIEGLKETLMNGVFPVRVQSYWLYGHGYAVSMFYGDLFLFLPAFLRIIGFTLMTSYKIFVFCVMAATAGICYYSVKKCTSNAMASFTATLLYTLAPYRIYNVYCRGAVGEYLAMIFFPLVICGVYRLLNEDINAPTYRNAKIPLIIGLSGILNCHMLSCELCLIFMAVICIIFYKKVFRKNTWKQFVYAGIICLLINCWYWVPFLTMFFKDSYALSTIVNKSIQSMGTWFAGIFQLTPYKGAAQTGMYHCEPIQIGIAGMAVILFFVIMQWICGKGIRQISGTEHGKPTIVFCALTIGTLILSTRYFPWDYIGGIKGIGFLADVLQFPTRFMALSTVFCAFFCGFFICWFQKVSEDFLLGMKQRGKGIFLYTVMILAVLSALFQTGEICLESGASRLYTAENMGTISVGNGEYLLADTLLQDYRYHAPMAEEGLEYSEYNKQGTSIGIWLNNTTTEVKYLELPLTGYKGYSMEGNHKDNTPYILEENGQHGDLKIAVPAGFSGEIKISYSGFMGYKIAEWISVISISLILIVWIAGGLKNGITKEKANRVYRI